MEVKFDTYNTRMNKLNGIKKYNRRMNKMNKEVIIKKFSTGSLELAAESSQWEVKKYDEGYSIGAFYYPDCIVKIAYKGTPLSIEQQRRLIGEFLSDEHWIKNWEAEQEAKLDYELAIKFGTIK